MHLGLVNKDGKDLKLFLLVILTIAIITGPAK